MGQITDFINSLISDDELRVATEATDDITKEVGAAADSAFGKTSTKKSTSTDTTDILGTATKKEDSEDDSELEDESDADNTDADDSLNDMDDSDDDALDEEDETSDTEDSDTLDEDTESTDDVPEEEEKESPDEQKKKDILHDNMIYLYDILKANIDILEDYSPSTENPDIVKTLQNVKSNLEDSKFILSNILKDEFESSSYPILLRQYIALKQVHDITIQMLEISFKNLSNQLVTDAKSKKIKTKANADDDKK